MYLNAWCIYNVACMQKNAMLGGAVTGALVSAVNNHQRDKVVENAITGGAIAAAEELLTHLSS